MTPTLCVFAKAPEAGRVKTRLAADLGETASLQVYQALLRQTAATCHGWPGRVRILGTGDLARLADGPLGAFEIHDQGGGSLAARLHRGLAQALDTGSAIAIGSDLPLLDIAALQAVAAVLETHPVAFGPAVDGGYWALGVTTEEPLACCCDESLPWSMPELLRATCATLEAQGHGYGIGPLLADCDTAEDLAMAEAHGFDWR